MKEKERSSETTTSRNMIIIFVSYIHGRSALPRTPQNLNKQEEESGMDRDEGEVRREQRRSFRGW